MGKRITRWALPVLLVTAVGACADKSEAGGEAADTTSAAASTPAPAPETAAAPAAAGAVAANLPAGVTPEMIQEGQQIFTSTGACFTCHGSNAEGTALAPNLTDSEWLWVTPGPNEYADLQARIKEGVPQPKSHPAPMPPMGGASLTDDQVAAVAAYVWSLTNKG